jgi:hypothetical protein
MFELYNLVSIMQSGRPEPGNIEKRIKLLTSYISDNFHETMYSNDGEDRNSLQYGEHVYEDPEVVKGFTRAGFTLESYDEDKDGWAPLNQVKQRRTLSVDLN